MSRLVLLAGPIAVGKSSVVRELSRVTSAEIVNARRLLLQMTDADESRASLQAAGRSLDRRTNGRWLTYALQEHMAGSESPLTVLDAVRTFRQTLPILETLDAHLVYLHADERVRRMRYTQSAASDPVKRQTDFDVSANHTTEQHITDLRPMAHLVLDTSDLTLSETVEELVSQLGLVRIS